jgi:hypothetical protein
MSPREIAVVAGAECNARAKGAAFSGAAGSAVRLAAEPATFPGSSLVAPFAPANAVRRHRLRDSRKRAALDAQFLLVNLHGAGVRGRSSREEMKSGPLEEVSGGADRVEVVLAEEPDTQLSEGS